MNKEQEHSYIIPPPPRPALPVKDSKQWFAVRRVYCIGQNYSEHTIEMGGNPQKDKPFFFEKNADSVSASGVFPYPSVSRNVHHEIELVVALGESGSLLTPQQAERLIFGYAVGLDMTLRDLQAELKQCGRPWEISKAFDFAAPCSPLVCAYTLEPLCDNVIWLDINGERKQSGKLSQMILSVPEIIAQLSHYFVLHPGDLIFTGTPAGVGPVKPGDILHGGIDGVAELKVTVTGAQSPVL